jgi:hypothetical protein
MGLNNTTQPELIYQFTAALPWLSLFPFILYFQNYKWSWIWRLQLVHASNNLQLNKGL